MWDYSEPGSPTFCTNLECGMINRPQNDTEHFSCVVPVAFVMAAVSFLG